MKGIKVVDGDWSAALKEAIRRKGEGPGDDAVVTIISPDTNEQEEATDDNTR
jgi:hypothetical protein